MGSFRVPLRGGQREGELLGGMITGAGTAVPTVTEGCNGFTIARAGVGLLDFTFEAGVTKVSPAEPGKWATTVTDIDGFTVVWGTYNTTTRTIRGNVLNESRAAADLVAASGLHLHFLVYR